MDLEELLFHQSLKRKEYEQQLNKNRLNLRQWIRYARWEADDNMDMRRARSIMERAIAVSPEYVPFWTQYVHLELKHKNANHARNILHRATTTLPRVAKLWFVYVHTEETLKNYAMVRDIFERWLRWNPGTEAWDAYVAFAMRYGDGREIWARYAQAYPDSDVWIRWAEYEKEKNGVERKEKNGSKEKKGEERKERKEERKERKDGEGKNGKEKDEGIDLKHGKTDHESFFIRAIYETALDTIPPTSVHLPPTAVRFARFEASQNEHERAHAILELVAAHVPESSRSQLRGAQATLSRLGGSVDQIGDAVRAQRKEEYEKEVASDPSVDTWWAYLGLGESEHLFERALKESKVGVSTSKTLSSRRYVYLYIRYALFMELTQSDVVSAREVWARAVRAHPQFSKLWIHYAEFELRHEGLKAARGVLGRGLGVFPKPKLFRYYIALESRLGEWERVRVLYDRWVGLFGVDALLEYVDFEREMNEVERAEGLLGVGRRIEHSHEQEHSHERSECECSSSCECPCKKSNSINEQSEQNEQNKAIKPTKPPNSQSLCSCEKSNSINEQSEQTEQNKIINPTKPPISQSLCSCEQSSMNSERPNCSDCSLRSQSSPSLILLKHVQLLKDEFRYDEARALYEKEPPTPQLFISQALFESTILSPQQLAQYRADRLEEASVTDEHRRKTRDVFARAERYYADRNSPHERLVILQAWRNYEEVHGTEESRDRVENMMPVVVGDGESVEYVFPEPEEKKKVDVGAFLENARRWASEQRTK